MKVLRLVFSLLWIIQECYGAGIMDNIVFAVNCGGEAHTDTNGVRYRKDYLKAGIASDYGRNSDIYRVPREDMILYQTERYDLQKFSYDIDLTDDGDYVLWMKFAEVWFNGPNMKVFQVLLDDEHSVIDELDIFSKAGRLTAHDEYIPFQIKNGRLVVKGRSSSYSGKLRVTFQRLDHRDNPKINALIIWRGSIDQIPQLPPIPQMDYTDEPLDEEEEGEAYEESPARASNIKRNLKTSGPKILDPYAEDQSSSFIPLLIAVAIILPTLFCLFYYQQQLTMNKQQFHDSGIVDEGLSDETGSVEDGSNDRSNDNDIPKKPSQSYLEIIAEAILKAPNRTMQLYEIYEYFQRKYRYFAEDVNKSWKNSVRHNLSLNDCFVKAGRGHNGKGHFWRIHELAERDFEQGRFRRRRYRQQMQQLQMQSSSYETPTMSSFYPTNSYYMSSPPPSYQAIYPSSNNSSEHQSISPIESPSGMSNFYMSSSTPSSYPYYDPYSTSYYPMPMSYPPSTETIHFDA
ncbi:hypothetical protein I4U23_000410 [Adineta vaga]|nr:hypothetical protein I4U23_000410 [Adineta vaga]